MSLLFEIPALYLNIKRSKAWPGLRVSFLLSKQTFIIDREFHL
jgi:hypothetical protein